MYAHTFKNEPNKKNIFKKNSTKKDNFLSFNQTLKKIENIFQKMIHFPKIIF